MFTAIVRPALLQAGDQHAKQELSPVYRLYYSPQACSLAPHILLEEIGVPYELELVQAGIGTISPEYRAINPKGRVPALSPVPGHSGGAKDLLTECSAIMFYLANTYPEAGLWPKSVVDQARALEWMNWLAVLHGAVWATISRPGRFTPDEAAQERIKTRGQEVAADSFAYVDSLLADGRTYAAGPDYSIADIYIFLFWVWGCGPRVPVDMRASFPAWARHADMMLARPAVQRVIAAEGVGSV